MIRYDLIKAEMLIDLVKAVHEHKGKNQSTICHQYEALAFSASKKAYEILSKDDDKEVV